MKRRSIHEKEFVTLLSSLPSESVSEIRLEETGVYRVYVNPESSDAEKAFVEWRASRVKRYFDTGADEDFEASERFDVETADLVVEFRDDDTMLPRVLEGLERPTAKHGEILFRRAKMDLFAKPASVAEYPDFAKFIANTIDVIPVRGEHGHRLDTVRHPQIDISLLAGEGNKRGWLMPIEELLVSGRNLGLRVDPAATSPRISVDIDAVVHCEECSQRMRLRYVPMARFIASTNSVLHYCSHGHQARHRFESETTSRFVELVAKDLVSYTVEVVNLGAPAKTIRISDLEKILFWWCAHESFRVRVRNLALVALGELGYTERYGDSLRLSAGSMLKLSPTL